MIFVLPRKFKLYNHGFIKTIVFKHQKVQIRFNRIAPPLFRSSPLDVFLRKGILKTCSKFTVEHPCQSVISIMLICNFIEITLWHGCSPADLLHTFRIPLRKNTSGRLLLAIVNFYALE